MPVFCIATKREIFKVKSTFITKTANKFVVIASSSMNVSRDTERHSVISRCEWWRRGEAVNNTKDLGDEFETFVDSLHLGCHCSYEKPNLEKGC